MAFIGAARDEWEMFSDDRRDYTVGAPIGFGASSIVYAAQYRPKAATGMAPTSVDAAVRPCALKVADLDALPSSALNLLIRETRLMSLSKHPNVLRVRGTWVEGHRVFIALRLMEKGSVRDVMRYSHIDGVQEPVLKCILKQALQGINYLHINGMIHRDIKAANLLVDSDGTVLLGDLGVAIGLADDSVDHSAKPASGGGSPSFPSPHGDDAGFHVVSPSAAVAPPLSPISAPTRAQIQKTSMLRRTSFVGTPCWMAPEVVRAASSSNFDPSQGYNASADIYSLGITALELAQGRAPNSLDAPHKALLKTLRNASPTLSLTSNKHKFSQDLKDIIDLCLRKDPAERPTAKQLLEMSYFKNAKKKEYLRTALELDSLPPLAKRFETERVLAVRGGRNQSLLSLATIGTVSSWDFDSSTTFSPSDSVESFTHLKTAVPDTTPPASPLVPKSSSLTHTSHDELYEADLVQFAPHAVENADPVQLAALHNCRALDDSPPTSHGALQKASTPWPSSSPQNEAEMNTGASSIRRQNNSGKPAQPIKVGVGSVCEAPSYSRTPTGVSTPSSNDSPGKVKGSPRSSPSYQEGGVMRNSYGSSPSMSAHAKRTPSRTPSESPPNGTVSMSPEKTKIKGQVWKKFASTFGSDSKEEKQASKATAGSGTIGEALSRTSSRLLGRSYARTTGTAS